MAPPALAPQQSERVRQRQRQCLKVAELVQITPPQTVFARQAPAQNQVDNRRMVERHAADFDEMPQFIFDFDLAGEAVP